MTPLEQLVIRHQIELDRMPVEVLRGIAIHADSTSTAVSVLLACRTQRLKSIPLATATMFLEIPAVA